MKYITSMQAAEKWNLTKRRVNSLCSEGLIEGAINNGYRWMIPEDAQYTKTPRKTYAQEQRTLNMRSGKLVFRENEFYGIRQPLPIGVSDFKNAVSEYFYVDKTLLIREIIESREQVILFTRPRRFGKTLNMNMLRVFFELSEEDTSQYFEGTNIWDEGEEYRRRQGKYPVIYFSFKDIKYLNWHDTLVNLKDVIRNEYHRHLYLADSDRLSELEKQYFDEVVSGKIEDARLPGTLAQLSYLLHTHHQVAPIIMIDEYDTPIQQGYMREYYDEIIYFMRNFLSGGLKDNPHITMAFLTGILRVAKESIFSGLNNLKVCSVLEKQYSEYFGFTKEEVIDILAKYGIVEKYKEIETWYDGYRFGGTEIFNPWSVLNYVDRQCVPSAYWQATGSGEIIGEIISEATPDVIEQMQQLLTGKTVEAYIDTAVVYPQMRDNPSSIFSFLLMAGYLTVEEMQPYYDGNSFCRVRIPNRELEIAYEKEVLSKIWKIMPQTTMIAMQKALYNQDADALKAELEKFLLKTVSYHDVASEGFYHGLVLGMSAIFNNYYEVTSNREEGMGRYDIRMKPYFKNMAGYVIELKALRKDVADEDVEAELAKLTREAIMQIDAKEYCVGLRESGCSEIVKIGMVFHKKKCKVKIETEKCER